MRAPVPAALPAEATCAELAVRNHAEHHRVLDVDVAAERAGEADAIDVLDAQVLHQQPDARVQRGLGELDGAHVVLRDLQRWRAPRAAHRRRCARWARRAALRAASSPSITPSWLMMPARYISAITSMIPEPQMPVTPVRATASSKPGSSDHRSEPMTLKRGSSVAGSMRTRSIAPGAARCPQLICAPSNAGPVGLEQASRRVRLPSTISALVPTSTSSVSFVGEVGPLGEDHAGGIRAHVTGDARQDVDARVRVQRESDLASPAR